MKTVRSKALYRQALRYFPGGVNSPVRAFGAVGGSPIFIRRGAGSKIYDEDGNSYVDYVMSWGALILGHANPAVCKAAQAAMRGGSSFGAPTRVETELARMIAAAVPSMERMRFVSSGTEAAMSAIRLSRGFTGRQLIVKFEGCYHGHYDALLVKAGSGAATQGIPGSAGVSRATSRDTIVCPYNDIESFRRILKRFGRRIACVIVEPVAANMGVVLPREEFLPELRRLTSRYGILLIFDEVITGFRLRYGSACESAKVVPDLTCLGKIIGGGLPMGAYGGRAEIMRRIAPEGDVYQAGTLSGNPVAVAAGIATLRALRSKDYKALERRTTCLCQALRAHLQRRVPVTVNQAGSLFTVFFTPCPVVDFKSAKTSNAQRYASYFSAMLRQGINIPPAQFEAHFLSFAHREADLARTAAAAEGLR